uniref:Uncharacterized protein n=1 Tax=Anguilla anguilla TaxID=7936 RepID=A0A0E9TQ98_ANGAN
MHHAINAFGPLLWLQSHFSPELPPGVVVLMVILLVNPDFSV